MPEAPYRAGSAEPMQLDVELGGAMKLTRYHLDGEALRRESLGGGGPPVRMLLAEVARVQLATLGGTTICTLTARDGTSLALSSGMAPNAANVERERAFASLLEALNERIAAASPDAVFVTGSWAIGGAMVFVALLCGGAVAWLARSSEMRSTLKFKLALGLVALLVLVAVPLAFIRGRPRPYDPRKIPRRYDPMPDRR